jgi:KDO2-lipid IV(A) lauroyltransferase
LSLCELAKTLLEMPTLWLCEPERVMGLIRDVSGDQLIRDALARGKGAILMSPHLGNWELAGLYCSRHYPITIMYRAQRSAAANTLMARGRARFGARLAPATRQGLKEVLRALSDGGLVGVLPDQNPGAGTGIFAPFFGIATYTPIFVARLARRTGAAVLLGYAERLPGSRGFHLHLGPAGEGIYDPSPARAAASMNADLEALIRTRPEQYWWSYKRFRKRPEGEAALYRS